MAKRDEMATRKRRSKVDSSSIQVADVDHGGLPKDKKNYKKSSKVNEVLQPKPSPNTKSSVRRLPKEVAKEKGPGVKTKVFKGKEKVVVSKFKKKNEKVEDERDSDVEGSDGESDSDKEHKGSEEADLRNESEEEGKGVKTKVFKGKEKAVVLKFKKWNEEVEADVEGNESEEDNESEEEKETEVSKESDDSEPEVMDVKIKGVKGNRTVVVSKAKKRKHAFYSSSEEEKVSKPKKVSKKKKQVKDVKKRKHVSDSSSSYDESFSSEEEKVSKPKKVSKNKKQVKDLKNKQVKDKSSSSEDEKPLKNKKHTLPQRFARFLVRAFSASSYEFKLEKGIIRVTPDKVREILGVPLGETSIFDLPERPLDDPFVKEWFNSELKTLGGFYIGPLCFLILLYLDSTKFDDFPVIHQRPAIQNWTTTAMNRRRELKIQEQVLGGLDLHGAWTESELDQTEGFNDVGVGDNVSRTRKSSVPTTDKKGFCSMIEKKISMIYAEKIALEDLFKRANAEFPNDGKVIELYEKYRRLFKESVFVEDFQAHIDDFDNNDNDGGGKNDDYGSDNVGKKKESAGKDVVNDKKDGVNAEKDGVNDVQEGEADVNEEPEDMLDEETFMQWIEKNIDWVGEVIDCLYDAYYEEDLFVWPRVVQPISVVCPQTPQRLVTRLSPNKRIIKPSTYLTSPYMNKRIKVTSLIKRLEFVLGNSLFAIEGDKYETVFETRSGHDLSSVRLNMKTLAPRLWTNTNVIDCWVAILNHEELVRVCPSPRRHFFLTGCITKAIIEWTINEEQQWKVFSDEISAQFKHDVSSISLFEVDLVSVFTIYASGHFYVVVFHLKSPSAMIILDNSNCGETYNSKYKAVCEPLKKFFARHLKNYNYPKHISVAKLKHRIPKLKWSTTKNHSDCEVFTMIHLEHYFGKPVGQWDFENMFDLASKFEFENDEQTRISIIVNAIKNKDERDPAKMKTFVKNQEDDTLKNK
nr:ulp1 protease family, C-terminal catalytic domain-containing protein [Tanacetum cinerariifolium]